MPGGERQLLNGEEEEEEKFLRGKCTLGSKTPGTKSCCTGLLKMGVSWAENKATVGVGPDCEGR